MNISGSAQKIISSLEKSGYVRSFSGGSDEGGDKYYVLNLNDLIFKLYEDKFSVEIGVRERLFFYSEIKGVVSHMNAEICSGASASRNSNFSLPLEIELEDEVLKVSVPFLAYSRFLNVLCELRGGD